MRRLLRAFLNFLDHRFPAKVYVTPEQLEEMLKYEERIKALEVQMANMNVAVGFATPKIGMLER